MPVMVIEENPRYVFEAEEVASWLDRRGKSWQEQQGGDLYWTVDGDPKLGSVLSVPCSTGELAEQVRKIGQKLTVMAPGTGTVEREAVVPPLDQLLEKDELGVPVLELKWHDSDSTWLLIEDEETSNSINREAKALGQD